MPLRGLERRAPPLQLRVGPSTSAVDSRTICFTARRPASHAASASMSAFAGFASAPSKYPSSFTCARFASSVVCHSTRLSGPVRSLMGGGSGAAVASDLIAGLGTGDCSNSAMVSWVEN